MGSVPSTLGVPQISGFAWSERGDKGYMGTICIPLAPTVLAVGACNFSAASKGLCDASMDDFGKLNRCRVLCVVPQPTLGPENCCLV